MSHLEKLEEEVEKAKEDIAVVILATYLKLNYL